MKIIVTGGAGLVGSFFCEKLLKLGHEVLCIDNLVLGTRKHIQSYIDHPKFSFETWDLSQNAWIKELRGEKFDLLIHLAANSDISLGHQSPHMDRSRTFDTTFTVLEAMRELKIPHLLFSSTSAVYGENPEFPTPEETTRMYPVSIYGAGKLASEAFISAFSHNYGFTSIVFRFGNVVGEKLTHGVIFDFVKKLRLNSSELQVLGDGNQNKTYIHVSDCVDGMWMAFEKKTQNAVEIYNLSTDGSTTVREIAEACVEKLTNKKAKIKYGTSKIGWVGDVPKTKLDVSKILALGWTPKYNSSEAVNAAIDQFTKWSS